MGVRKDFLLYTFDGSLDRRSRDKRIEKMREITEGIGALKCGEFYYKTSTHLEFTRDVIPNIERFEQTPTLVVSCLKDIQNSKVAQYVVQEGIPTIIADANFEIPAVKIDDGGWISSKELSSHTRAAVEKLNDYLTGAKSKGNTKNTPLKAYNALREKTAQDEAERLFEPLLEILTNNPDFTQTELAYAASKKGLKYKRLEKQSIIEGAITQPHVTNIFSRIKGKDFWKEKPWKSQKD